VINRRPTPSMTAILAPLVAMLLAPIATACRAADPADHEHGVGGHGGLIVSLGRDSYHVEPVFERDGVLRMYLLGADETRLQETGRQTLTAYVRAKSGGEALPMPIVAEPQEGDADDKTSRFKGLLPESLRGVAVEVTIPNLRIDGERFRVAFSSVPRVAAVAMPAPLPGDEAATLFLTPGGLYTAADIEANGRRTPQQTFAKFRAKHDADPKVGDRLCPISETKANPACTWVVAGKTYEFCCPPCVEEFVRMAKETPDAIRDPDFYVKRAAPGATP